MAAAAEYVPTYVRTEDIDEVWAWAGPLLKRALDKVPCPLTVEELRQYGKANMARFWAISRGEESWPDAVAATVEHKDDTVEILALAGGDMRQWLQPAADAFADMAREVGKTRVVIRGRRGWLRALAPLGYVLSEVDDDACVIMEKVL